MSTSPRTAVVTGAGSGIGRALALRLAQDGASVVIADLRSYDVAAAAIARATGARTLGLEVDVASESQVERMAAETARAFGRLDILVNNAAIFSALELRPFEQIAADEWRKVMEVNTLGVFLCCRACVPHMRRGGFGRIINLASGAPLKGVPFFLHYIASKGAVIAMTRGLARELGRDNIRVNSVAPSAVITEGTREFFGAKHDKALEALAQEAEHAEDHARAAAWW